MLGEGPACDNAGPILARFRPPGWAKGKWVVVSASENYAGSLVSSNSASAQSSQTNLSAIGQSCSQQGNSPWQMVQV